MGGPAVQLTEETGFKLPAQHPEQAVSDLAKAMFLLANDSKLRVQMGQAGQKQLRERFAWETKCQLLAQLYKNI